MSTNRRLRRTMGTRDVFSELQKPLCKIADLPGPERKIMRGLIRFYVEQQRPDLALGTSFDAAALVIEGLIDKGVVKIIIDQAPKGAAEPKDIRFRIVPTGKHRTTSPYPGTPNRPAL